MKKVRVTRKNDPHLICRDPEEPNGAPPILFIHGAFAGAWCWDEFFLPWFAEQGYRVHALDLPGRRGRPDYKSLQERSLADYQETVLAAIDHFEERPIVVGHSMGGYLAWRAGEIRRLAGLVLMAPVPPTGLAAPAMQLAVTNPGLFADVAEIHAGGVGSSDTLHASLFSDAVPKAVAKQYVSKFQGESRLAVAGLYAALMPNILALWGTPIKVLGAGSDPLIPPAHVHWTASLAGRAAHIYQGMGHGMMLETGWRQVCEDIVEWFENQGLAGRV